jgi:hypothetical protein
MAQMMRAILLASATAASFFDLRASNSNSHGEARPVLACRMTAVAPSTSSRRRLSSPSRLILPGRVELGLWSLVGLVAGRLGRWSGFSVFRVVEFFKRPAQSFETKKQKHNPG